MQKKDNSKMNTAKNSQRRMTLPLAERAALSPSEFASIFGKQKVWGYRQCYLGRVNAITEFGRMMIPRSEIERILSTAAPYSGKATK
jgi:hypothetical protein